MTPSPKADWQALRRRYTWHLRLPYRKHFDSSHWWKGRSESEIEPAAALYELARRHPLVRDQWLTAVANLKAKHRELFVLPGHPFFGEAKLSRLLTNPHWFSENTKSGTVPCALYWTCLFGFKSWAKLDYTERKNWQGAVGYLKGLDFRSKELRCRSINDLAHWKIVVARKSALRQNGQIINEDALHQLDNVKWDAALNKNLQILHSDLAANPPTAEEWEAAIAYRAVEAYRQGFLLVAVAPDLESNTAASLMEKVYGSARRSYARPKQRARCRDWLPIIASFEDAEVSHKAYAQEFARYRRVLDGIRFV